MPRFEPTKTIADARAAGETALTVHCQNTACHCHHQARKTFDELKLPPEMIFVHVPQFRCFVCNKCGGRIARVMPIFPDTRKTGIPQTWGGGGRIAQL